MKDVYTLLLIIFPPKKRKFYLYMAPAEGEGIVKGDTIHIIYRTEKSDLTLTYLLLRLWPKWEWRVISNNKAWIRFIHNILTGIKCP